MRTIKIGSKSQQVKQMQELLNGIGYRIKVDGDFGKISENAIKQFQFNKGLTPDGVVGNNTWDALLEEQPKIKVLKSGDNNDNVKLAQQLLLKLGYKVAVDGDFGKQTRKAVKKFQKKAHLKADGVVGPKTWRILNERAAKQEQTKPTSIKVNPVVDESSWLKKKTWDKHTDARIKTLHPLVRAKFIQFIIKAEKELKKQLRVTSGLRTIKEQNKLYAQGRTRPGKIVTNAKGGKSYHNFGLAVDIVEIKNGKALWSNPDWGKISELGKSLGLEWGGDWVSIKDKPHFQVSFGKSTSKLFALYNKGKRDGEYVRLG